MLGLRIGIILRPLVTNYSRVYARVSVRPILGFMLAILIGLMPGVSQGFLLVPKQGHMLGLMLLIILGFMLEFKFGA